MRNHTQNVMEKLVPDRLPKNKIVHFFWSTVWKFSQPLVILCPSRAQLKNIETKVLATCFYLIYVVFFKKKKGVLRFYLSVSFSAFFIKILLILYSFKRPHFIVWLTLFLEILGNMCIITICFPVDSVINFEINFSFLVSPFS